MTGEKPLTQAAGDETVEQLHIRPTNTQIKYRNSLDQIDNRNIIIIFSPTKYFEIRLYVREYPSVSDLLGLVR